MNLRSGQRDSPDINLTPLIDVVFLLLIFFMVSTTFSRESELSIELPEATAKPVEQEHEPIEIAIDSQGRYFVNNKPLVNTQIATLVQAIRSEAGDREAPPILINADAQTPHQAVVNVMDAAQQMGFLHLTFAARLTEPDTKSTE